MNFGNIIKATCENVAPPPDSRCSDPAFALANPDICPVAPFLVLKPAVVLSCTLGSVQLRAVYTKDGSEEDVTDETIFTTSDPAVAVVGASSGNATGVAPGQATFRGVYNDGTQNHEAFTTITVLGENCCEEQTVAIMVLVDNSKSMSQSFGAGYTTRLAYAKAAATRLIDEINESKDVIGLLKFNAALTEVLSEPIADKDAVAALVPPIPQTQQLTSFHEAITQAVSSLDGVSADRRIIVIISDGEDSTASYNDSNNPISAAEDFKSSGGIVMSLGVRAHGRGYALLSRLSTGGFFVNGYGTTAAAALNYISGLKGYICAGNCVPEGDEYVASGAFNYTGFQNWDVEGGYVDLQGAGFFDYLPGNGMYVDLISGMQPSGTANGSLVLKDAEGIAIESGKSYRLTVTLAGNQQVNRTDTVKVRVFWRQNNAEQTEVNIISQTIALNDYTKDFSDFSYAFTADADRTVFISIQQVNVPTGDYFRAGALLARVRFDGVTDFANLFDDDFDTENLVYVPPACGTGSTYLDSGSGYGYVTGYDGCYGTGCLDEPPIEQLQDPSPLPEIELGSNPPPKIYTSTKTKCVTCPDDFENLPSEDQIPTMTSATAPSGTVFSSSGAAVGFEAWKAFDDDNGTYMDLVGVIAGHVGYRFTSGKIITHYVLRARSDYALSAPSAWTFEGSNNGSSWTVLDTHLSISWYPGEQKSFAFNNTTSYTYYRLNITSNMSGAATSNLALAEFQMQGFEDEEDIEVCATATETSESSQQDADSKANAAALVAAQALLNCGSFYTSTMSYTAKCPVGTLGADVTKSATRTSLVSQKEADDAALAAATAEAEAALDCTLSNNTQQLCILDQTTGFTACAFQTGGPPPTEASPYPGVKFVTGGPASITKVTVSLNRWNHGNYAECYFLLVSPSGTSVLIVGKVMDAAFDSFERLFVVDDDAASPFPEFSRPATIGPHTYQPTLYGPQITFPSPAPAGPYATTLATFAGEDANGAWNLYVCDNQAVNGGYLSNGWDLTIS